MTLALAFLSGFSAAGFLVNLGNGNGWSALLSGVGAVFCLAVAVFAP